MEPAVCIRALEVVLGRIKRARKQRPVYFRSDVGPGNTTEWRSCLPVLAKGGFRFKVVFESDFKKHFGSDLMTDTRGVFKGSSVSVRGFECGHSLHGRRCAGENSTPRWQEVAVVAEGSVGGAQRLRTSCFSEGDTDEVRCSV